MLHMSAPVPVPAPVPVSVPVCMCAERVAYEQLDAPQNRSMASGRRAHSLSEASDYGDASSALTHLPTSLSPPAPCFSPTQNPDLHTGELWDP